MGDMADWVNDQLEDDETLYETATLPLIDTEPDCPCCGSDATEVLGFLESPERVVLWCHYCGSVFYVDTSAGGE